MDKNKPDHSTIVSFSISEKKIYYEVVTVKDTNPIPQFIVLGDIGITLKQSTCTRTMINLNSHERNNLTIMCLYAVSLLYENNAT